MSRRITKLSAWFIAAGVLISLSLLAVVAMPRQAGTVTAFEGGRLIVGDGSAVIENGVFIVDGNRFTQMGRSGQVQIPSGARRVDLRGKTVMPAIVDTHTHMAADRQALIDQLRRKAYYGVGAAMSLGQDTGDVAFRYATKRYRTPHVFDRGARNHNARARAGQKLRIGSRRCRSPKGRAGTCRQKSRYREDLGGRSERRVQETDAGALRRHHR